jgi:hypothetical protein
MSTACRTDAEIIAAGHAAGAALPPLTREQMTRIELALAASPRSQGGAAA